MNKSYAIIELGGKQYFITPGERIIVDNMQNNEGETIELEKIYFYKDENGNTMIGKPQLNMSATFEVLKHFKDEKLIVYKKTRRETYERTMGYRSRKTELLVKSLNPKV